MVMIETLDKGEIKIDNKEVLRYLGYGKNDADEKTLARIESLWKEIEQVYINEAYKEGYVKEALEKLGKENFAIQLQGQRLGGGYYRLYHNISTW